MTLNSFTEPLINPCFFQSHLRISLELKQGRFELTCAESPKPIPLPRLDGRRLEQMAQTLRTLWKHRLRAAMFYLYLNCTERAWETFTGPAILHGEEELILEACRQDAQRRQLRQELVLCGCFTSSPVTHAPLVERLLPSRDGLFLVWHPTGWLNVSVMVRATGHIHHLPLHQVLRDQPDDGADNWMVCHPAAAASHG